MVARQALLVDRVLLEPLVILEAPEGDLAKTVEVGHLGHLRIVKLAHHGSGLGLVVNLWESQHTERWWPLDA